MPVDQGAVRRQAAHRVRQVRPVTDDALQRLGQHQVQALVRAGRFGNVALVPSLLGAYLPSERLYGVTKRPARTARAEAFAR